MNGEPRFRTPRCIEKPAKPDGDGGEQKRAVVRGATTPYRRVAYGDGVEQKRNSEGQRDPDRSRCGRQLRLLLQRQDTEREREQQAAHDEAYFLPPCSSISWILASNWA